MSKYTQVKNKVFWRDFFLNKDKSTALIREANDRSMDWTACAIGTLILPDYYPVNENSACKTALKGVVRNAVTKKVKLLGDYSFAGTGNSFPRLIAASKWARAKRIFNEIQQSRPKISLEA